MTNTDVSARGLSGCLVDSCGKKLVARGMCRNHYKAWHQATPKDQRPPAAHLKGKTPEERFKEKTKQGGPHDCWRWIGSKDSKGYGQFYVSPDRRIVSAQTFAVELATGIPCPEGHEGCHRCDTPDCVNPTHIYYGTRADNVRDMVIRERNPRGSRCSQANLTEGDVLAIRRRFANGETQTVLASEYEMSGSAISMIVNGLHWSHVGGPIRTHGRPGRRYTRKVS